MFGVLHEPLLPGNSFNFISTNDFESLYIYASWAACKRGPEQKTSLQKMHHLSDGRLHYIEATDVFLLIHTNFSQPNWQFFGTPAQVK